MTTKQFTITRTFDAPRAALWQAWTDPTFAARWWHPHEVTTPAESVRIDLRTGGGYEYLMIAPDGSEFPTAGTYLEISEPEHLKFTWGTPGDGDTAPVATVDLTEPEPGRTTMVFALDGEFEEGDEVEEGWGEAFEVLAAELATARPETVTSQRS